MGVESHSDVGTQTGRIFLSYASQDAQAAQRICDALRAAGIPVWFDRSELRGGDAWDRQIRDRIHDCRLFIAVISANTEGRDEGYFRREWKFAVDRTNDMSEKKTFLIPIVIDNTLERGAAVPDKFLEVQWTRLPSGETPPAFVDRLRRLLSPEPDVPTTASPPASTGPGGRLSLGRPVWAWPSKAVLLSMVAIILLATLYFVLDRLGLPHHSIDRPVPIAAQAIIGAPSAIPENSIAVLPFADMSERRDQEYFADGLCEELIDLLARVQNLTVTARTSSFYFKARSEDVPTIAHRLMVAHVLEGSVRKSGTHLRVTAQLVRADTGYQVWSETYDRELDDLFKVQDDIAGSVVKALKLSILHPEVSGREPTSDSEAHTLYLHALSLARLSTSADSIQAYKDLRRALTLDPDFALAWSALANLLTDDSPNWREVFGTSDAAMIRKRLRGEAFDAANRSLQLDPNLAQAHLAMGRVLYTLDWNWQAAAIELQQAHRLDPASTEITLAAADLAITMGRFVEGLKLANLAIAQDPLGTGYWEIGAAKHRLGELEGAVAAYQHLTELYPSATVNHYRYALVLLSQQKPQAALTEIEHENAPWYRAAGMALVLDALGRGSEADRELTVTINKYIGMAYQISYVYAARGDNTKAIYWLERAYQLRDTGLLSVKNDPMLKNVQHDPRFTSLMHKLNLAN